jgi:hypothetical protein
MHGLRSPVAALLSGVIALLGVVLIVETAIVGGTLGYLLGTLFVAAGGLRLALLLRRRA